MKTASQIIRAFLFSPDQHPENSTPEFEAVCQDAREFLARAREVQDWKSIAEDALSAAEFILLFWNEGFGTEFEGLEKFRAAVTRYKEAGGEYDFWSLDGPRPDTAGAELPTP
jgi:hypothetical protein